MLAETNQIQEKADYVTSTLHESGARLTPFTHAFTSSKATRNEETNHSIFYLKNSVASVLKLDTLLKKESADKTPLLTELTIQKDLSLTTFNY